MSMYNIIVTVLYNYILYIICNRYNVLKSRKRIYWTLNDIICLS